MSYDITKITELFGDRLRKNEPLARYTTFKIGGPADYFVEVRTSEELSAAITTAQKSGIPVFILGGGSNILIGDRGIRGLVIKNLTAKIQVKGIRSEQINGITKRMVFVEADSGVPINKLVRYTVDEGLAGLHMHLGLPGTVGGAVYMNSKWTHPDGYVGDAVYQIKLINTQGTEVVVPHSYFRFAYDYSILQKSKEFVISVVFALEAGQKEALWEIANQSIGYRRETQPQGILSAGCTFRNISKAQAIMLNTPQHTTSAGFLVDHAGLKGLVEGEAQISPIHANFIQNVGKARASDVVKLIELARTKVKEKFGVELEEEIERVGEF